jgi:ATP-dependent helicase/nuclease subunit A
MAAPDEFSLYAFARNQVVAASAGTGKTHVLVGVLVHALLGASELDERKAVDPTRIVATTFSRKARGEILERLRRELDRIAEDPLASPYGPSLLRYAEARALASRARRALPRVGQVGVTTLHAFAGTLLRRYAKDLGPDFEMLDEHRTRAELSAAVDTALERVAAERPEVAATLVRCTGGLLRLRACVQSFLAGAEEKDPATMIIADDASAILDEMERFHRIAESLDGKGWFPLVTALGDARRSGDAQAWEAAVIAIIERKNTPKTEEEEALRVFVDALGTEKKADRARAFLELARRRDELAPVAEHFRTLAVAARSIYRQRLTDLGALDFGEVQRRVRDLLRDAPDVAREVGARFDLLLVDEFQDTSPVQGEMVRLLWQRADLLHRPGYVPELSELRPRGLFIVGDRKQSIYGFRGADASIFAAFCVGLAGEPARLALGIAKQIVWEPEAPSADFLSLTANRRSTEPLLRIINPFSARVFRPEVPIAAYEVAYNPETEDLRVPASAVPLAPAEAPRKVASWLRPPVERVTSTKAAEAEIIAGEVERRAAEGRAYRDFAVLAQSNAMLEAAAFALACRQIPYVVFGSRYFAAREVRDVRSLLALVHDARDTAAMLEVLRGPWVGLSDDALLDLVRTHGRLRLLAPTDRFDVREAEAYEKLTELVSNLSRIGNRLGPAETARVAIETLDYFGVLGALPRGAQRIANVEKLLRLLLPLATLREAVGYLDAAMDEGAREGEAALFSEEDDAVRLLTVHASKGLAFPVVFLPEVGKGASRVSGDFATAFAAHGPPAISVRLRGASGRALVPPLARAADRTDRRRDRAERQRVWYVAATRAAEELVFVGDRAPPKEPSDAYANSLVATLLDLPDLEARDVVPETDPGRVAQSRPLAPVLAPVSMPSARRLVLAPTALSDFHHCPRRFAMIHLWDIAEVRPHFADVEPADSPAEDLDVRREGTMMHKVLERIAQEAWGDADAEAEVRRLLALEGAPPSRVDDLTGRLMGFVGSEYARDVRRASAVLRREEPFLLDVPLATAEGTPTGGTLALRGTIDLLVAFPDGRVHVIDYKRARGPSPLPYAFQLQVYQLAARRAFPAAPTIEAGVVFLGTSPEPRFIEAMGTDEALLARLSELGSRFVRARGEASFPRVPIDACRAIHCGYVPRCHPR